MAENLLISVSAADDVQSGESASTSNGERDSSDVSQRGTSRAKRVQVAVACQPCRRRKIKCDALRPCTPCSNNKSTCLYETQDGETRLQASKRKYDEMVQSHDTYAELFRLLRHGSERDAAEVVRQIQSGRTAETVLRFMKTGDITAIVPDPRRIALETFLVSLAHSTGSLKDIDRLATSTLDPATVVQLPNAVDFLKFRNRIVHLSNVETLLHRSERLENGRPTLLLDGATQSQDGPVQSTSAVQGDSLGGDDTKEDDIPHRVPAAPWTTITKSDEAVSHLVSLFLAWINVSWRFVEQDLFLKGMRSKRLNSEFCSPFLVNGICAIASLHSEDEIAFAGDDRNRVTRGQHFHNEALRLWELEKHCPTLTNVQALCVLSMESNYRAVDRLGLSLITTALQLNNDVCFDADEKRCAAEDISKIDFTRGRLSAHYTATCTHLIMQIAFMSNATAESRLSNLAKIPDIFEDKTETWIGYPLTKTAVTHRPTLYLRERCRLIELFQEMHDLILLSTEQRKMSIRGFACEVDRLLAKMRHWHQFLPVELHYTWPMSIAVWELHASYLSFSMVLCLAARARFEETPDIPNRDEGKTAFKPHKAQTMLSTAIPLAHTAAQYLRNFRERYGLKITPPWLHQLQAVTAGVLMADPELKEPTTIASTQSQDAPATITDSHNAFDEVFRCLLGTGVEVMIARAIARMMYHTAMKQKIALSRSTRSMLQIMSDTAWRPEDLGLVNSVFPNFATTRGLEERERMTELLSRRERLEI